MLADMLVVLLNEKRKTWLTIRLLRTAASHARQTARWSLCDWGEETN